MVWKGIIEGLLQGHVHAPWGSEDLLLREYRNQEHVLANQKYLSLFRWAHQNYVMLCDVVVVVVAVAVALALVVAVVVAVAVAVAAAADADAAAAAVVVVVVSVSVCLLPVPSSYR